MTPALVSLNPAAARSRWLTKLRQGWRDLMRSPLMAWLDVHERVSVIQADGTRTCRAGSTATILPDGPCRVTACVLPEAIVLRRRIIMADLATDDLEACAQLHARELSPFSSAETLSGWVRHPLRDGRIELELVLAARVHAKRWVAACRPQEESSELEVWAEGAPAIVLAGFDEAQRRLRVGRGRRQRIALLISAALLTLALIATPALNAQRQLDDARRQLATQEADTRHAVQDRETLLGLRTGLEAVTQRMADQPDLAGLLAHLSKRLPDDAHLTRMEVSGRQVRISGFAQDAARLIETLGREPGFIEVRTPSAITRTRTGLESFTIEFTLSGGAHDAPA